MLPTQIIVLKLLQFTVLCWLIKRRKGFGNADHKPAITPEDMARLYDVGHVGFSIITLVGLQQQAWFQIMFYLCRCVRGNLRKMPRETFAVATDSTGSHFVYKVRGERDKNQRKMDNQMIQQVKVVCVKIEIHNNSKNLFLRRKTWFCRCKPTFTVVKIGFAP